MRVSHKRIRLLVGLGALGSSEEGGRRGGSIDEDVVFLKFLDVGLNLVHLSLKDFLAAFFANSIELAVMGLLLVVTHKLLPLFLKGSDELLTFLFGHQHALTVTLVLLFNLHLPH